VGVKVKVHRSIGWNLEYATMNITQIITDGADCYPWREVYAWWPIKTISGKTVWRRKIYKRKVWIVWGTGFHMEPETQYAEFFEILKDGDITN
jgi:hypothetical protein